VKTPLLALAVLSILNSPAEASNLHPDGSKSAEALLRRLSAAIQPMVRDPNEPWAVAHGLEAFGPGLKSQDGRPAVRALVEDVLVYHPEDKTFGFPKSTRSGQPADSHENLILAALVTSGVPVNEVLGRHSGKSITLRLLLQSAEAAFSTPNTPAAYATATWTLTALFSGQSPDRKAWSLGALNALEALQGFLEPNFLAGRPDQVEKKKQGIYGLPCGGFHLVQAVGAGLQQMGGESEKKRFRHQLDLLLFRLEAEARIYRTYRAKYPQHQTALRIQELKFYGHLLETLMLSQQAHLVSPPQASPPILHRLVDAIADVEHDLAPLYAKIRTDPSALPAQQRLDLIGDGCHAIRGIRLALVAMNSESR
jgi:hypothetical protein